METIAKSIGLVQVYEDIVTSPPPVGYMTSTLTGCMKPWAEKDALSRPPSSVLIR